MKLKIFKNTVLYAALLASASIGMSGCTDLDETVYSELPEEELTVDMQRDIMGYLFDRINDMYSGWEGYQDLCDESGDLLLTPQRKDGWGVYYVNLHTHEFIPETGHYGRVWNACTSGINACNQLLDLENVHEDATLVAELRTYRAFFLYIMFDVFRNIPVETTFNVPEGYMPEQKEPKWTYDFIVNEVEESKPALGKENKWGQINYYGACMILAKMYLNHDAWFPNEKSNEYYQKACDQVNEIINDGPYALAATYKEPFSAKNQSSETIFAIPHEKDKNGNGTNYFCKWYSPGANKIFGLSYAETWNGSAAIPQFIATYDSDDTRKSDTWRWGVQHDQQGNVIYVDGKELNYSVEVTSARMAFDMEGARMQKYEIVSGDVGISNDPIPFFRLTDAYFIKAECLLRLGGYKGETEQDAADIVTMIRQRAFRDNPEKAVRTVAQLKGGSVYDYGQRYTSGEFDTNEGVVINPVFNETHEGGDDIILGGLLDDLAWEFVYEHHRRQDLIRFTMTNGMNVYNGKSWFTKLAESDRKHDIMPINDGIIRANPKLNQNPY